MKDFELLPHTADIKVRVYGATLADFFHNAVVGMFQAVGPIIEGARAENERVVCTQLPIQRAVHVASIDLVSLLVDFLSEALYLSDVHNEAYLDATIHTVSETEISATLHGAPVKGFQVVELKAVTYHDLQVQQIDGVWQADIVFDI